MYVVRCVYIPKMPVWKVSAMYTAKVITVSDRCYNKTYEDLTGPAVSDLLLEHGYEVDDNVVVPDETSNIKDALCKAVNDNINLIITAGGTGFSKRDVTPEATLEVIEKLTPGICEYMRMKSMEITPRGMLSRGVSGIKNNSLIINLPGSPKAACENLSFVLCSIEHGLKMLLSDSADCANE